MNNLKISLLAFILLFVFGFVVSAQEPTTEVKAEDLEIGEPKILSDSPFYFLKNLARDFQMFITFNPVKKLELKMKFTNEKLYEVQKLSQKTQKEEIIKKAIEKYEEEMADTENRLEKIKEILKDNSQIDKFLNKFTKQQVLHQRILEKLKTQVPSSIMEKIKQMRERHLERFNEVIMKVQNKEKSTLEEDNNFQQPEESVMPDQSTVCAQVITFCIDPKTKKCTQYPDACSTPKPCKKCTPPKPATPPTPTSQF